MGALVQKLNRRKLMLTSSASADPLAVFLHKSSGGKVTEGFGRELTTTNIIIPDTETGLIVVHYELPGSEELIRPVSQCAFSVQIGASLLNSDINHKFYRIGTNLEGLNARDIGTQEPKQILEASEVGEYSFSLHTGPTYLTVSTSLLVSNYDQYSASADISLFLSTTPYKGRAFVSESDITSTANSIITSDALNAKTWTGITLLDWIQETISYLKRIIGSTMEAEPKSEILFLKVEQDTGHTL